MKSLSQKCPKAIAWEQIFQPLGTVECFMDVAKFPFGALLVRQNPNQKIQNLIKNPFHVKTSSNITAQLLHITFKIYDPVAVFFFQYTFWPSINSNIRLRFYLFIFFILCKSILCSLSHFTSERCKWQRKAEKNATQKLLLYTQYNPWCTFGQKEKKKNKSKYKHLSL